MIAPSRSTEAPRVNDLPDEYMAPPMLLEFHTILSGMRAELIRLAQTKVAEVDFEKVPDDIDMAAMRDAAEIKMRRDEREVLQVKSIDKSLAQIKGGDYGYCEDCGGTIGSARMRVNPTACLCISCKELKEKMALRHGKSFS